MPAPHDPAALTVNLAAVSSRGARIAISAEAAALGFEGAEFEAEFDVVGSLHLHGRMDRVERDGFRLLARLRGELRLECVRCLEPAPLPVDEDLDLVYLPRSAESGDHGGGERALDASDMNVSFYDEDRLELARTVWEQLHLALPVKPLCSAGCRGLCSSCGADRNREPDCGCDRVAPAPRGRGVGVGGGGWNAFRDLSGLSGPAAEAPRPASK